MEFTEVLNTHGKMINAIVAGFSGQNTEVDDLKQEAYIAAWLSISSYRPERGSMLHTYLSNCVRNALIQRVRRDNRFYYHNIITEDLFSERLTSIDLTAVEVEEIMQQATSMCSLRSYQLGIYAVLKKMEGQSYRKTAIELGVSEATVKRHRKLLVQVLEKLI